MSATSRYEVDFKEIDNSKPETVVEAEKLLDFLKGFPLFVSILMGLDFIVSGFETMGPLSIIFGILYIIVLWEIIRLPIKICRVINIMATYEYQQLKYTKAQTELLSKYFSEQTATKKLTASDYSDNLPTM